MKCTAIAPSNLALIKYWGKADEKLKIPLNGSISFSLSGMKTTTTVEFRDDLSEDDICIEGISSASATERVVVHLDLIRSIARSNLRAKVVSKNSFPSSTGLSSSASGFAALTVAACASLEMNLSQKDLSIISRQGSGSSCRSIVPGWVEWQKGRDSSSSFAFSIFPPDWMEIVDVVSIISKEKKEVGSTDGQKLAQSSIFLNERLKRLQDKILDLKKAVKVRDFSGIGEIAEKEALEMHAVMMTSNPSLVYFEPSTISVIKFIRKLRAQGLEVYFSLNTGQDIHIICRKKDLKVLLDELEKRKEVRQTIVNYPDYGTVISKAHLF